MSNQEKHPLTVAFTSIESGTTHDIQSIIKAHPELIDQCTYFAGGTLLHYAAVKANPEIVGLLIEMGFGVNARGKHYGDTPLRAACCNGRLDNAHLLLDRGATIDTQHSYTNPLFGAIVDGHLPIVALLIGKGIDTGIRYTLENGVNVNAAEFAELRGQQECADFIRTASKQH